MSDVKRYGHISYLVEATPKIVQLYPEMTIYVLAEDYNTAKSELSALREELDDMQHWRDLALQFDNHRMKAMWHLKTLVSDGAHYDAACKFLEEPPVSASDLQQRLTAAEQRNAELTKAIADAEYRTDQGKVWNGMGWTYTGIHSHGQQKVLDILRAALKPTESGASE